MRKLAIATVAMAMTAAFAPPALAVPEATVAVDAATVGGPVPPLGTNVMESAGNLADPVTGAPITAVTSFLAQTQKPAIMRWGGLGGNCYDPANTDRSVPQQQVNQGNHNCDWTEYNGFQTSDFITALQQVDPAGQALMMANPCWIKSANPAIGGTPNKPACNVLVSGQGTEACPLPPTACPGATITANRVAQMRAAGQPHRYWELGNEVFANGDVPPAMYKAIANKYVAAMKEADPDVLVGGDAKDFGGDPTAWDAAVAGSDVDFLSTHLYWPNKTDMFSTLRTAGLPAGYRRIQSWAFDVPAAGGRQIAVDAKATGADASLTLVVDPRADGTSAGTITKTLTKNAAPVRTVLSVPALAAGRHELSVQVAPAATALGASPEVALGHGWVCDATCPAKGACPSGCRAIDLGLFPDDDPYAIAVLNSSHGTTRTLTTTGPASLQIIAYATPGGTPPACPTLKVQVDGGTWSTLTLAKATGTIATQDACYSFLVPSKQAAPSVTLSAGTHSVRIVSGSATGEVDVKSVAAVSGQQTLGQADLSPNPGGRDGFAQFTYGGLGSDAKPGPVLARLKALGTLAASSQMDVMVSEFGAQFLSAHQASTVQGESLMAALYDAAAVQTFTRRSPALLGMLHWALDNVGFRSMQCARTSAWDLPWERTCATQAPYNSLVGWVFTMIRAHTHDTWVRTDTSAPTFTVDQPIYDADGTPVSVNPNSTTSVVQALATKGTGVLDVQLVNFASHPVTTLVTVAGAATSGSATLQSLSGDLKAVDGCRLDVFNESWGCSPTAIVPGAPQTLPASASMTITLPASSFSTLSVPAS
jgi:hypothetical protein